MNLFKYLLDRLTEDRFNCLFCGDEMPPDAHGLCAECLKKIEKNNGPKCPKCSRPVYLADTYCDFCRDFHYDFDSAYAPLLYEGNCAELIKYSKFYGKRYVYKYLVEYLCESKKFDCDVVCAVPDYGKRRKSFAYLLAKRYAERNGVAYEELLIKTRETEKQHKLGKHERLKNLKGAFAAVDKNSIRGRKILIIDDVLTTGATMSECAAALKKGKPESVCCLCLAVTPQKPEHGMVADDGQGES